MKICHNLVDLSEDGDDNNDGDEIETYFADPDNPKTSPRITSLGAIGKWGFVCVL